MTRKQKPIRVEIKPGIVSIFNVELVAEERGGMYLGTRHHDPEREDDLDPLRRSGEEGYQVVLVSDREAEWYARRILWLIGKGPDPGFLVDFEGMS